ncbi:MAG TPA: ArsA family ATPase [Candidatus Binataceae bacterium]|nr:ArsA family ATPase [Candidatus Binataceae bacterium]
MLADLLRRRVVFLLGKGGVGTTSVSAALATAASERGDSVLAMETDVRAPMANAFGIKSAFEPVMVSDRLFAMVLEGRHSLEEYLKLVIPARTVMRAVFASRLYQFFVNAAPGLKELMMLGKIYYEAERKLGGRDHWDLIVVDGPASGQALSLLKMPGAARQTFGDSVVGREAGNIIRALRDEHETAIVLVTTPEPLPISETLETVAALREVGINPAAIVFNRTRTPNFSNRDVAKLKEQLIANGKASDAEYLARIARSELDRAKEADKALAQLRDATSAQIIELPMLCRLSGGELARALAQRLTDVRVESFSRETDAIGRD